MEWKNLKSSTLRPGNLKIIKHLCVYYDKSGSLELDMFADDDELALAETAAAKNGNIHNDQVQEYG